MEVFLGMIALFGFNYAPRGWMFCAGQTLSISEFSAMFALLGTQFGGNGTSTFQLPDLRGRTAIGFGQGNGMPDYRMGQTGGETAVTLTTQTMPTHNHTATATSTSQLFGENTAGNQGLPKNKVLAGGAASSTIYLAPTGNAVQMADESVTTTTNVTVAQNGGNLPHDNMQPYLALNYCIAMQGIFPSRN